MTKVSIDGRPAFHVDATAEEVRTLVVNAGSEAMGSGADPDDAPAFMRAWDERIADAIRELHKAPQ